MIFVCILLAVADVVSTAALPLTTFALGANVRGTLHSTLLPINTEHKNISVLIYFKSLFHSQYNSITFGIESYARYVQYASLMIRSQITEPSEASKPV